MLKKLICTMLVFSIISVFGMAAFAAPTDSPSPTPTATPGVLVEKGDALPDNVADVLDEAKDDTKQSIVTITRPDDDTDSTYKSSYVLSGASDYTDVTVVLKVYDEETGKYILMENVDGESKWDMGSLGMFSKEIELQKGANKIMIQAFRQSKAGNLKVEDIQVNRFTVYLNDEGLKAIINTVVDFTEKLGTELGDIFKSKIK